MHGQHNVLNCLASICVAIEMGISEKIIRTSLNNFKGIKRRFENKGVSKNGVRVIDDYGHHPVEISYALSSGRILAKKNKLIAIFQPHRYSRLKDLFNEFCQCFNNADYVFIADVYAAGEKKIENFNKETLASGISDFGHNNVSIINNEDEICGQINKIAKPNDVVIFLGAGNITKWSDKIELHNSKDGFFSYFLGENENYLYAYFKKKGVGDRKKIVAFDKKTMKRRFAAEVIGYSSNSKEYIPSRSAGLEYPSTQYHY